MKNLAAILGVGVGGYLLWKMSKPKKVNGCTDSTALNYNELATNDDGTCQYADPDVTPPMGEGEGMEFGGSGGGKGSSTSSGNTGMGSTDPYDDAWINTKIANIENELGGIKTLAETNESELGGVKSLAESNYSNLDTKASALDLSNLTDEVATKPSQGWVQGALNGKASVSSVNTLGSDLETFSAKANANETALNGFEIDLGTFDSELAELEYDVNIAKNDITSNATTIGYNTQGVVDTNLLLSDSNANIANNTSAISTNSAGIASNLSSLGNKANTSYVDSQVGGLQQQIDNFEVANQTAQGAFFSGGSRQRRSGFIPNAW